MEWIHALIILCLSHTSVGKAESSEATSEMCKTPDDQDGECTSIRECKPYVQILKRGKLNADETKFLRQAQCGFKDGTPFVCCPSSGVVSIPGGEAIDNHGNWKLLDMDFCGPVNDRAIFSVSAGLSQYPMLALLSYENSSGKSFLCSGSLINDRYVLTAAHCIQQRENVKLVSVRLGEHDLQSDPDCEEVYDKYCSEPVQDINIEEVILHPQFEFKGRVIKHDIALIRLEKPAKLNTESVVPVCLPTGTILNKQYEDAKVEVPGWQTGDNGSFSGIMLTATQSTMPNDECSKIYDKYFKLGENQICVGDQSRSSTCREDSGGPLLKIEFTRSLRTFVVGVKSFGPRVCNSDMPAVYTRVAPYMQWILDNLKP